MCKCHRYGRFTCKRNSSRKHLIHCDTQRVYIASGITSSASCLLRRNIMYRTYCIRIYSLLGYGSCYAEICNLYFAVICYKYILRLYISMHYMLCMSRLKRSCHLYGYTYTLRYIKLSLYPYIFFQGYTVYKLHYYKVVSTLIHYVIDIYYIFTQKTCRRLCLSFELFNKV